MRSAEKILELHNCAIKESRTIILSLIILFILAQAAETQIGQRMKGDSMKIVNSSLSEGSNMGIFKLEKARNEDLRNTMATLYSSSAPSSR